MGLYVFSEGFWGIGFGGWWCRAGLGLELVIAGAELRVPGVSDLDLPLIVSSFVRINRLSLQGSCFRV